MNSVVHRAHVAEAVGSPEPTQQFRENSASYGSCPSNKSSLAIVNTSYGSWSSRALQSSFGDKDKAKTLPASVACYIRQIRTHRKLTLPDAVVQRLAAYCARAFRFERRAATFGCKLSEDGATVTFPDVGGVAMVRLGKKKGTSRVRLWLTTRGWIKNRETQVGIVTYSEKLVTQVREGSAGVGVEQLGGIVGSTPHLGPVWWVVDALPPPCGVCAGGDSFEGGFALSGGVDLFDGTGSVCIEVVVRMEERTVVVSRASHAVVNPTKPDTAGDSWVVVAPPENERAVSAPTAASRSRIKQVVQGDITSTNYIGGDIAVKTVTLKMAPGEGEMCLAVSGSAADHITVEILE